MDTQTLMVSICCITYNQDKFLAKAIDSYMMQKTDFEFDIVIGNDCSSDGTREILEHYKEKYADKIKVISSDKKMGTISNLISCNGLCKGKYIAFCKGDDIWADPNKLQKQVDLLETNPKYQ
ncbi:MAG: glycosyltransferase [Bacteroidota bacterium]|nr:glycosyltransferase [Bacteroidota bacterium]